MAVAVSDQIGRSGDSYFASQSLLRCLKQDELSPTLRSDDRGPHYGSGLVVAKIEGRVGRNAEKGQALATRGAGGSHMAESGGTNERQTGAKSRPCGEHAADRGSREGLEG